MYTILYTDASPYTTYMPLCMQINRIYTTPGCGDGRAAGRGGAAAFDPPPPV